MFETIKNKIVILTGASGLIGYETYKHLKRNEATVVAVDIRGKEPDYDLFWEYDITQPEEINRLVDTVMERFGRIDGLVSLAYPRTRDWGNRFEDIALESWRKNVDMQMNMVFFLCQRVLEIMKRQQSGSVVNIGSIYGVVGNDFTLYEDYGGTSAAAYTAIKGGLINFTRFLASYYGPYNVRVNCVSPGGIIDTDKQHSSFIQKYSARSPLRRLGNPEEIAPAITFLLSDEASYITGHNLMVDGGWTSI